MQKKVKENENRLYSEKCGRFNMSCNPRFKIWVRIVNGTGSASFLLWDHECLQLIEKSASELRDRLAQVRDIFYHQNIFLYRTITNVYINLPEFDSHIMVRRITVWER